ncbi:MULTISPECIES: hypothetical protein [Bacteroides]|jgi:hypothetical protein|uniref:Uncharacterized protein n=1 Tax=Bacteroides cellulosilyticus DSM 14838 TaxID=537012 RepID=E2N700_9BACE|nr:MULTISPECIES: hypothetical protein [Bacteroides]EEF92336.1 hypothetical protein BACCELL_00042 [Bacteroides cellulosilyticus DSM 14838]MBN9706987.1 hypothetical protein [Bacteroides cellulosilyticus]MCB6593905.1 hypothetical protein [Bacteroides cellulosilyticus]MCE8923705.1 hypothetical protein [Bacteroides ovatus]MDC2613071.1 hypothetical protein [Bacteroides ovatus]
MNTLKPNFATKEDNGVNLLRKSSKIFLIVSQIAGIIGAFAGIMDFDSLGIPVIAIAILIFVAGYLVRGFALCIATIAENSEKHKE